MKKILFALAMLVFGASALQQAKADVSIDFFYDNLSGGNWIDVEGYGYGWQPDVAVNDTSWRPYADGYWAYTDDGWTWVSYEDFGWATYHYGRWANLSDYGWIWFPGEDLDWGPAWVSWRTGGDYVGWAPLPPRGPGVVYEGRPIGPQVDIEFDIGPEYYNFCEVRYIGEPVLRNYIAPPAQNFTYINNTVNVTNITVRNNVVYNYGPNYDVLSAHSNRPIQRLSIERQSAANFSAAAQSGTLTKVQGNKLLVAAPARLAKAPPTAKPRTVKTKVAQPKLNRGWAGVPNEAQLKQKIKTENPKNVPPPTGAAVRPGSPAPGAPGVAAKPGTSPGRPRAVSPAATPRGITSPVATPRGATAPATRTPPGRPGTSPAGKGSPAPAAPGRTFERGKRAPTPQPRLTPGKGPAGSPGVERKPPAAGPPSPPPRHTPPPRAGAAPGRPGEAQPPPGKERGRIERGGTPPPAGPGARELRGGAERGQPPGYGKPRTPPAGAGPGEGPGVTERGQPPGYGKPRTPPAGAGPGEGRGVTERGQPPGYGKPRTPPAGAGPGEGRGVIERGQPGVNKPPITPPAAAGPGEARGGRERGQGAYGQPGGQPRGAAPAPGAVAQPAQGQPERGKKKGEGTPPPRP